MVAAGAVLGIPCAYAVARVLRGSLFRLEPLDPATNVAALAALLTIAGVAAWLPARRAAAVDPLVALREE
jgi:ABC-type antimicrobial peptide transport system permease subunit